MTSRAGSLIVAVFLGGFSLLAVILIIILTGGDGDESGSALLGVSLRDGDVVLLGERVEIRVSARDDEPVVRFALLVDGTLITQTVADDADDSGTFSGSLGWVPDRLGLVTLTVEAQSVSGATTSTQIQVEVSDSLERVRAAPRLTIVSPPPFQRLPVTRPLGVLVRAESGDPIVLVELQADGVTVDSVVPQDQAGDNALITLTYVPTAEGFVTLQLVAQTAGGAEATSEITVEFVSEELAPVEDEPAQDEVSGENGILVIRSPSDLAEIEFREGLTIDVEIEAFETGTLQSIELYVNTLLTESLSAQPFSDGSYRVVAPFRPGAPGEYALEVVAISSRNLRFDSRVDITVLEPEDEEPPPEEEEEPPPDDANLPDLVAVGLDVGEGNAVVVTVQNVGQEPVGPIPVLITVIRTADSLLLAEEIVTLSLGPAEGRLVQLELGLTDTIDITVIVDTSNTVEESNEDNNTFSAVFEPLSRPDLVAQGLQVSEDGLPIVSLVNAGSDAASGPIAVVLLFNGVALERLSVAQNLASQGTLTLAGSIPIDGGGQLSAIVDPDNAIAEADETNNTVTIEVAP